MANRLVSQKKSVSNEPQLVRENICRHCGDRFVLIVWEYFDYPVMEVDFWDTSFLIHKIGHINKIVEKSLGK